MEFLPGTFSWIDLATDDQAASERFYTSLLDLDSYHAPIDGGGHYVMLTKDGKGVAGIGAKPDPGMPTAWQSYIHVDDVDETARRVEEHGGTVIMGPFDVMESGRMAVIADPTGAVVSLWQPGAHGGGEVFNEHGTHTWNELMTRDVSTALEFYRDLLGWTYSEIAMGDQGSYHVINVPGKDGDPTNGGIMGMTGIVPDEVPPHWDVYFWVDDADPAIERAVSLGGSIVAGPMDTSGGRLAYLADPQGGMFYVITPSIPAP